MLYVLAFRVCAAEVDEMRRVEIGEMRRFDERDETGSDDERCIQTR